MLLQKRVGKVVTLEQKIAGWWQCNTCCKALSYHWTICQMCFVKSSSHHQVWCLSKHTKRCLRTHGWA